MTTSEAADLAGYTDTSSFFQAMKRRTSAGETSFALEHRGPPHPTMWDGHKVRQWIAAGKPQPSTPLQVEPPEDLRKQLDELHDLHARVKRSTAELEQLLIDLIHELRSRGLTLREVGALVEFSPARVRQLDQKKSRSQDPEETTGDQGG